VSQVREWSEDDRRVLVIGPPGVGKTWVARRLAGAHAIPHIELDGLKLESHGHVVDSAEYEARVRRAVESNEWLLDGNWTDDGLAEEVWSQAGLIVWLDFPRRIVMAQVLRRSIRRLVSREDYFGHTESLRGWLSPTHPIRWSWHMVRGYADRYQAMTARLAPGKHVRLQSRPDAARFVQCE
jgi:adenylate kinase family enzyme